MSDLISREAAIEAIESHLRVGDVVYPPTRTDKILNHAFEIAASCIYNLPTAERVGKWEEIGIPGWKCSCCGEAIVLNIKLHGNYCPNCGARMEGEGDDER